MIDKQPVSPVETEESERPPQYGELEDTIQDLIIGNDQSVPTPEHDTNGSVIAVNYRIHPGNPGAGSVIGFNYRVRIPEDREQPPHIAVHDGFNEKPEWEWDMGAPEIISKGTLGELTPERADRITQLIKSSDYYREQKGLKEAAKSGNPFTRWFRSKH